MGLRWEDIDFQDNVINVSRAVTHVSNQPIVGLTKSKAGVRQIPLDDRLLEILSPHEESGFIVGDGITPLSQCGFVRAWERIGKTIDLHGATPHILRHTYITLAASTGMDVKTLQTIAGHADISTTMNRYAHGIKEKVQQARVLVSGLYT